MTDDKKKREEEENEKRKLLDNIDWVESAMDSPPGKYKLKITDPALPKIDPPPQPPTPPTPPTPPKKK